VLAVADGVVEKVGTLPISGNRLWLRTPARDEFFYAHLSAFSPDAVNGRHVKAGTVLGFTGNTGDAEPTPPHVHFEIHPGGEAGRDRPACDPARMAGAPRRPPGAWLTRHGGDTASAPARSSRSATSSPVTESRPRAQHAGREAGAAAREPHPAQQALPDRLHDPRVRDLPRRARARPAAGPGLGVVFVGLGMLALEFSGPRS
jgi:hypothetical protein